MSLVALDWQSPNAWMAVCLFAGILSYFSCLGALGLARRSGMITQPGKRQSHEVATPTGGGLGLIFSIVYRLHAPEHPFGVMTKLRFLQ